MNLFVHYLKSRIRLLAFLLLCILIFALVFALYQIPLQAVVYPGLLCLLAAAVFGILDFEQVKKKHETLTRMASLEADLIGTRAQSERIIEQEYAAVIESLCLQQRQLQESLESQYSDMLDYFTMWVHQIKTPISALRLQLQSLDRDSSRKLKASLFRIEQYVEMVLAFMRLDAAQSDYVFKEQPLHPIIAQAVRKFSAEFISRRIALRYDPIDMQLITDAKWLSFVLEQILSNALKYTKQGEIRIYLKAPKILCVEDSGIGIQPEDLPRIFEKGYTGCNGRQDLKASGLGLYLCKRVCTNISVGICAVSTPGKGTRIELNLEQYPLQPE